MRQAGVLSKVLPESEKWGIDAIHGLVTAERDLKWPADPMLRLEAIVPPDQARMREMAKRLRLSNGEAERLDGWSGAALSSPRTTDLALRQTLSRRRAGLEDRLKLALAGARVRAVQDNAALHDAAGYARLLKLAHTWEKPFFPIKGSDLLAGGLPEGPNWANT
jgi:poly(A) polymerase